MGDHHENGGEVFGHDDVDRVVGESDGLGGRLYED